MMIVCSEGFYMAANQSAVVSACRPCRPEASTNSTDRNSLQYVSQCNTSTTINSNTTTTINSNTSTTININTTIAGNTTATPSSISTDLGVVVVALFLLGVLVDVLYVLLFSRNFIRRSPGRLARSSCLLGDGTSSRLIGTVGINLHVVLACVHFFGLMCQLGVVEVSEDTLVSFIVIVGVLSVVVYFLDTVLFAIAKRLLCVTVCFLQEPLDGADTGDSSSEHAQSFLDRI